MFLLHLYDGYAENFRLKEEVQLELNAVGACKNIRKTSKKFIILLSVKKIRQSYGVWEFLLKNVLLPERMIETRSKYRITKNQVTFNVRDKGKLTR